MSKAGFEEMNPSTRKCVRIKCESQCDLETSLVQFPPSNIRAEEAWLCPGPPVRKPCGLHPSRRAQDDCPNPRQARLGEGAPPPNHERRRALPRRHDEGMNLTRRRRGT